MKARAAGIAGSVIALTVIGGFAAASTFQSVPVAPVAVVQPVAVETVAPVMVPTTAAPVVTAPAPVVSTQAPAPVVAPKPKVVVVPKAVAPAADPIPAPAGMYQDGTPVKKDAGGNVIPLPAPPGVKANCLNSDGSGGIIDFSSGSPVCVTH